MLRIGLVEDNPGDARLIQEMLREPPITQFRLTHSTRMDQLLESLEREPIEVLLLDLGLPDSQGMDTFHRINNRAPGLPIVIFSGADDEQLASELPCRAARRIISSRDGSTASCSSARFATPWSASAPRRRSDG